MSGINLESEKLTLYHRGTNIIALIDGILLIPPLLLSTFAVLQALILAGGAVFPAFAIIVVPIGAGILAFHLGSLYVAVKLFQSTRERQSTEIPLLCYKWLIISAAWILVYVAAIYFFNMSNSKPEQKWIFLLVLGTFLRLIGIRIVYTYRKELVRINGAQQSQPGI